MQTKETVIQPRYATLREIANESGLNEMSVRIKMSLAKKMGLPLPERRRIGKQFIYDKAALMQWLWNHSDQLRRKFELKSSDATE